MNRKAIIFDVKGYYLTKKERILFKKKKPWGVILFSRNIKNINKAKQLVNQIKNILKDKNFPILIDQEGGRVCRLNNIIDLSLFSQNFFTDLYKKNRFLFPSIYKIYVDKVSEILRTIGVNINTVPVLDIRRKRGHNIIGTRSFSENRKEVSILGNICINLFKKNKIGTVVKHIPGHGLSKSDSHLATPTIFSNKKQLIKNDFKPFRICKSFFAMTAHIIYRDYDSVNTATHSKIIIKKVIRSHIKFNGILISDDISMKSLKGTLELNAIKAIKAGCNLVLHCNGNIKEMIKLADVIPNIDNFTKKKTSDFYKFLR